MLIILSDGTALRPEEVAAIKPASGGSSCDVVLKGSGHIIKVFVQPDIVAGAVNAALAKPNPPARPAPLPPSKVVPS